MSTGQGQSASFAEKKGKLQNDRNKDKVNQGLNVMKSKSRLSNDASHEAGGRGSRAFPTDQEIEFFQGQLSQEKIQQLANRFKTQFTTLKHNITLNQFQKFLVEEFGEKNAPAQSLIEAMFNRFKPFRMDGVREDTHIVNANQMDVLDFILAMNLLARILYDKKLKLLFYLCDDDEDGCMTPEDILNMLQRVERVFARECSRVDLESTILDNFVADKKAEMNFHYIMGMIRQQNIMKNMKLKQQSERAGQASPNSKKKADEIGDPKQEDDEDNLITQKEFMSSIKSLKNLYKSILPRTLSFKEVLMTTKQETEFHVSKTHLDDFGLFRYEINSIFKKYQFEDDNDPNCELFMGRHPLSKTDTGKQIKDEDEAKKLLPDVADAYRPPGLVRCREEQPKAQPGVNSALSHAGKEALGALPTCYVSSDMPQFQNTSEKAAKEEEFRKRTERNIWMAVPQPKIYKRKNVESKMELEAKRQRLAKYEASDQLVIKTKKKEGDKAAPADSLKLNAKQSTKIEKQATTKTVVSEPVKKEDLQEIAALKKIKLDAVDPKQIDPKERKESLPPETQDLQKAVNELINSKENSNKIDLPKLQKKNLKKYNEIKYNILPRNDEDPEHREISKKRFDIFKQDEEKAREAKMKESLF